MILVKEPLRSSLNDLAISWAFPILGAAPAPSLTVGWTSSWLVSRQSRATASSNLFARMGMSRAVIGEWDGSGEMQTMEQLDRLAQALWHAGRYRDALTVWQRVLSTGSANDEARLAERTAAVAWVRGQLLRARRLLRIALRRWVSQTSKVELRIQVQIVELYGRVLTHMRRTPDTRWLVRPSEIRGTVRLLDSLEIRLAGKVGIHLRARVASVRADLLHQPDDQSQVHVDSFEESESLQAWFNYRQGRTRQLAAQQMWPSRLELDELFNGQMILGGVGDAARVVLLPGSERVYPVRFAYTAFKGVDVTAWHRGRIVARMMIAKLGFLASTLLRR